jgi:hypothetical protein
MKSSSTNIARQQSAAASDPLVLKLSRRFQPHQCGFLTNIERSLTSRWVIHQALNQAWLMTYTLLGVQVAQAQLVG